MATATTAVEPRNAQAVTTERTYTNLETALYRSKHFTHDLARFCGTEEAAAALVAEIFNQARHNPELHRCTVDSIRLNVARIAALHLNPALPNMVHFIPRNMQQADKRSWALELTTQYGYAGLRELVMRSEEVKDCFTKEVCANDHYESPASPTLPPMHRLPGRFQPRGPVEGYYAVIELHNGNWRHLQMSLAQIEAHVDRYCRDDKGKTSPAWEKGKRPSKDDSLTPFDKQALKTVLRMLCNGRDVPMTPESRAALDTESADERPPTAAQYQGYDRQGQRAAITEATGLPLDELLQDVSGTQDKAAVETRIDEETRGKNRRRAVPEDAPERLTVDPETGQLLTDEESQRQFWQGEADARGATAGS